MGAHFSLTSKKDEMTLQQVKEFNTTFGVRMRDSTNTHDPDANVRIPEAKLRFRLIKEELEEFVDAVEECDIVEVLDALGDIEYVTDGAALVFGVTNTQEVYYEELIASLAYDDALNTDVINKLIPALREAILRGDAFQVGKTLGYISAYVRNTAAYLGLDVEKAVDAIHKSNMSKLGENGKPIYREDDGKVLKGPNYKTPTADLELQLFGETSADTSQ